MQVVSGEYDPHLYAVNGHLEAEQPRSWELAITIVANYLQVLG